MKTGIFTGFMARHAGFEPATYRFVAGHSIHWASGAFLSAPIYYTAENPVCQEIFGNSFFLCNLNYYSFAVHLFLGEAGINILGWFACGGGGLFRRCGKTAAQKSFLAKNAETVIKRRRSIVGTGTLYKFGTCYLYCFLLLFVLTNFPLYTIIVSVARYSLTQYLVRAVCNRQYI